MTQLIDTQTRQILTLTKQIASSGEGCVWRTSRDGFLAKVYHHSTPERIKKLEVMVANPPEDRLAHLPHISYAWPVSILMDQHGQKVGFLMPEIKLGRQLTEIYNPRLRKINNLEVDWQFLHATAYNIALFMEAIHKAGYVIGDMKPENILVNPQALPSIIDTDSFQVIDSDGTVYPCPVGSEGFTPPELAGKNFTEIYQTEVHDRFRLAVIVFTLLFGYEPFKGLWKGGGDAPEPSEWVKRGYWAYGTDNKVGLADYMIPLEVVHPEIKELFLRCFNDGYRIPSMRPTVTEWKRTLATANAELQRCSVVNTHFYHREHHSCYWCDRKAKGIPDIFEFKNSTQVAQTTVQSTNNLKTGIGSSPNQYNQQMNNPNKVKWDRHIENWFTDTSYKRRLATDFAFRNQVVPGYENQSAVSPQPVTAGQPIQYDQSLAATITSEQHETWLKVSGVFAGIGAVILWFGGGNLSWVGWTGIGCGGLGVTVALTSVVDDSEKARQEREKAQKERERIETYEKQKKQEEQEINKRIEQHQREIDIELQGRLHSFSLIPVQVLTDINYINSLSYADQICVKMVLEQIKQQQQAQASQSQTSGDGAELVGGVILAALAILGMMR